MANSPQARKRARQADKHRLQNASARSRMRTSVKKVLNAVAEADPAGAQQAYKEATALIDQAANKGLIHKNKAARHKSRLNARVRALG